MTMHKVWLHPTLPNIFARTIKVTSSQWHSQHHATWLHVWWQLDTFEHTCNTVQQNSKLSDTTKQCWIKLAKHVWSIWKGLLQDSVDMLTKKKLSIKACKFLFLTVSQIWLCDQHKNQICDCSWICKHSSQR